MVKKPEQMGMFQPDSKKEDPEAEDAKDQIRHRLEEEGQEPTRIYVDPKDATVARRRIGKYYGRKAQELISRGLAKLEKNKDTEQK